MNLTPKQIEADLVEKNKNELFKARMEAVMDAFGEASVEEALNIVCSMAGQLASQLSGGAPGQLDKHVKNMAKNIHRAGLNKIIWDNEQAMLAEHKAKGEAGDTS